VREGAVGVHDERTAVEDELVLAADLVDVGEGKARFRHAVSREVEALVKLLDLERRPVRDKQQLRAGACQV
jgi:hypothetical protein